MIEELKIHKILTIPPNLEKACGNVYAACQKENKKIQTFFLNNRENNSLPTLYYATINKQVVGFISVDCVENIYAEICGFVLPDFRNRKIMSRLFDAFLEDYDECYINTALKAKNSTETDIISHLGFEYVSTEYAMKYDLTKLSFQALPSFIQEECTDTDMKFCLFKNSIPIGLCMAEHVSSNTICIHDVSIDENFRRKSYSFKMLNHILSYLSGQYDYAVLHVTKENTAAVSLYKKLGFEITDSAFIYKI